MRERAFHNTVARHPRHHDSEATRQAILQAAERIFAEEGLAGARTDAIAAAAGVNKALLYYYFRSKEGLYRAVLESYVADFNRQALNLLSSEGSACSILLRYINLHFDFIAAHRHHGPLFQRMLMTDEKSWIRLAREQGLPRMKALLKVIERGIRTGELRHMESFHIAISLVALVVFYFSSAPVLRAVGGIDPYNKANVERRREEVLKFVRYALFKNPECEVQ
ncbi:MAG TPA: TetR/AcrR family transcriptional regulator [Terriglobia bacterium]|nr:TetR/AcrR family transcriptional regulator [Terriglobia bacterium]